jgi:hypothetical protein
MKKSLEMLKPGMAVGLLGFILILMLASCATQKTYTAPNLGVEQTAILDAKLPIWIVSIDGEKVSSLSLHDTTSVKLLPGPHLIEVVLQGFSTRYIMEHGIPKLERSRTYGEHSLKLRMLARPGCKYFVDYTLEGDNNLNTKIWKARIVELDSV